MYLIRIGSAAFGYTNHFESLSHDGETFVPVAAKRTQPTVSPSKPGAEIMLDLATDEELASPIANAWIARAPEGTSTLTIFKRHLADSADEVVTFYAGGVVGVRYSKNLKTVHIKAKGLEDLLSKQGPRQTNGSSCDHQLYDINCQLNQVLHTQTALITAVDTTGLNFTIPGLAAPAATWVSGTLKLNGGFDERMIIAQSGDVFSVRYPVPGIEVGDAVDLSEGCGRNMADCVLLSNIENYGGAAYRTNNNPFTVGLKGI